MAWQRNAWLWFAGGYATLAAACLTPEHVDTPPPERCSAGLLYCDGNVSKACGDDGYVASSVACLATQTCIQGECQKNHVCDPGQTLCVRNRVEMCNADGTGLESKTDCGEDFCTGGSCVPASDVCPPLAAVCVGNSAALCTLDGSGYLGDPVPCGNDALCVDGMCQAYACEPGVAGCDGEVARTCNIWGTGYSDQQTCSSSAPCVRGRCQATVCTPGTRCVGDRLVTCSSDGTAEIENRSCGQGRICVVDHCEAVAADAGGTDRLGTDARRPDSAVRHDARQPDRSVADAASPYCQTNDDSYEPNDLRTESPSIANAVSLSLVACDEHDWFATTVPANQALAVQIDFTAADCDLDLAVYAPGSGEVYDSSASTAAPEKVVYDGTSGTVLIRVFNYSWPGQHCSYTLTTALRSPPVCGDGAVEGSETCDTLIASGNTGACPTECYDYSCSTEFLAGSGCHRYCDSTPVTACTVSSSSSDSCCPETCTALTDYDCPAELVPCGSDSSCTADRYCDLDRAVPACKLGCRHTGSSGCDASHRCASDHRCVLNSVAPHGRCASCRDTDPCADGFTCDLFGQCAAICTILIDDRCAELVNANSSCFIQFCSQDDCP